jgi:hypothetical protein
MHEERGREMGYRPSETQSCFTGPKINMLITSDGEALLNQIKHKNVSKITSLRSLGKCVFKNKYNTILKTTNFTRIGRGKLCRR